MRTDPEAPMRSTRRIRDPLAGSRGHALAEFALVLPILLFLIVAVIDIGHLIQTRLILTNVSREGGSIGSRQTPLDGSITDMLLASGRPLDLGGADGRLYVTRVTAGADPSDPEPRVLDQYQRGSLAVATAIDDRNRTLGLTEAIHDRLTFRQANGTADIPQVTVVEIFYKYRPITPLPNFIPGLLTADGGGLIIRSKAVF
jgi:hypothetical protein